MDLGNMMYPRLRLAYSRTAKNTLRNRVFQGSRKRSGDVCCKELEQI